MNAEKLGKIVKSDVLVLGGGGERWSHHIRGGNPKHEALNSKQARMTKY